jgi:hypothetical protein
MTCKVNEIIHTSSDSEKKQTNDTSHTTEQSSDYSKQLVLNLTFPLALARLGRHRRLTLAHDALPREDGVGRYDVRLVVQPAFDVECHVDRGGGAQHAGEGRGCHLVVVEAAPLETGGGREG